MPQDEPTLGEVLRRLEEVSRQMIELARELKEDRAANAATFVRQDVYIAQRLADQSTVADLHGDIRSVKDDIKAVKEDRQKDIEWRRQHNLTLAGITITALVSISLTIVTILTR
jgi:hypothetical protein